MFALRVRMLSLIVRPMLVPRESFEHIGPALLGLVGLVLLLTFGPLVIGYCTALSTTLGAVPDYFRTCRTGWTPQDWYTRDALYIPVDTVERYITHGCPSAEQEKPPPPDYITNEVFRWIRDMLDRGHFIGYHTGWRHVIEVMLPAWNTFGRKLFVPISRLLGVILSIIVGVLLFKRFVGHRRSSA